MICWSKQGEPGTVAAESFHSIVRATKKSDGRGYWERQIIVSPGNSELFLLYSNEKNAEFPGV